MINMIITYIYMLKKPWISIFFNVNVLSKTDNNNRHTVDKSILDSCSNFELFLMLIRNFDRFEKCFWEK